jgi:hypothetical protein
LLKALKKYEGTTKPMFFAIKKQYRASNPVLRKQAPMLKESEPILFELKRLYRASFWRFRASKRLAGVPAKETGSN